MVYLIDASALVLHFIKKPANEVTRGKRQIARLITSCPEGSGRILYVPNFCMAECSKAFSRIFIGADGVGEDEYRRQVDGLLDLVSSKRRNVVKPYELHRKHFVDIEDIFLTDRRLPLRDNEKPLSGLDGLVIAMGRTLI